MLLRRTMVHAVGLTASVAQNQHQLISGASVGTTEIHACLVLCHHRWCLRRVWRRGILAAAVHVFSDSDIRVLSREAAELFLANGTGNDECLMMGRAAMRIESEMGIAVLLSALHARRQHYIDLRAAFKGTDVIAKFSDLHVLILQRRRDSVAIFVCGALLFPCKTKERGFQPISLG